MDGMKKVLTEWRDAVDECLTAYSQKDSNTLVRKVVRAWLMADSIIGGLLAGSLGLGEKDIWSEEIWNAAEETK